MTFTIRNQLEGLSSIGNVSKADAKMIADILEEVVQAVAAAGPLGLPGGKLYAHLMAAGMDLETFNNMMAVLLRLGRVTKRDSDAGDVYRLAAA